MKVGDLYEAPTTGATFTVVGFDKQNITVDVQRFVRNGKQETRRRVVPTGWRFDIFARPYTNLNGRKRPQDVTPATNH